MRRLANSGATNAVCSLPRLRWRGGEGVGALVLSFLYAHSLTLQPTSDLSDFGQLRCGRTRVNPSSAARGGEDTPSVRNRIAEPLTPPPPARAVTPRRGALQCGFAARRRQGAGARPGPRDRNAPARARTRACARARCNRDKPPRCGGRNAARRRAGVALAPRQRAAQSARA